MLKFGIFRLEDFRSKPSGFFERIQGRLIGNRISLQLLRTAVPPAPREIEVFEAIMSRLRLNSGIFRTTSHARFRELDPFVNEFLLQRFPAEARLAAEDWAASDCLTSSEWASSLFAVFPGATLRASDLTLFVIEVTMPDGEILVLERGGEPLQYIAPPFAFNWNIPVPRPRPLGNYMAKRANAKFAALKAELLIPQNWLDSAEQEITAGPLHLRKLPMTHPEAEAFRARDPRFAIARHSAFESLPNPVDVIRSMNIYNPGYFSPDRLAEGARAIWSSLKPGGYWIVGRTWTETPPTSNVSILERCETGFKVLCRFGEGSEIEPVILAAKFQ